jgi:hypothetical protein
VFVLAQAGPGRSHHDRQRGHDRGTLGRRPRPARDLNAESGMLGMPARDQLVGDGSGGGSRDRKPDSDVCVNGSTLDLRVDADHMPEAVEQRATGVPVVDRRVRLDRILNREAVRSLNGSAPVSLMIPAVIVPSSPKGFPIAYAGSQTSRAEPAN